MADLSVSTPLLADLILSLHPDSFRDFGAL